MYILQPREGWELRLEVAWAYSLEEAQAEQTLGGKELSLIGNSVFPAAFLPEPPWMAFLLFLPTQCEWAGHAASQLPLHKAAFPHNACTFLVFS